MRGLIATCMSGVTSAFFWFMGAIEVAMSPSDYLLTLSVIFFMDTFSSLVVD
jgi:hypothetical protein